MQTTYMIFRKALLLKRLGAHQVGVVLGPAVPAILVSAHQTSVATVQIRLSAVFMSVTWMEQRSHSNKS